MRPLFTNGMVIRHLAEKFPANFEIQQMARLARNATRSKAFAHAVVSNLHSPQRMLKEISALAGREQTARNQTRLNALRLELSL